MAHSGAKGTVPPHEEAGSVPGGEAGGPLPDPSRTCIVTRAVLAKEDLLRFVVAPDHAIVPDLAGKLPGRGVWVSCSYAAVSAAAASNAFARSLKRAVSVPLDLADRVGQLLERRLIEALALANKAGAVIAGFVKVEEALGRGAVHVLLHASDGGADGVEKLDRKARAVQGEGQSTIHVVRAMSNAQLSLALGRANVVHAAVARGGTSRNILSEAGRLERYRSTRGGIGPSGRGIKA